MQCRNAFWLSAIDPPRNELSNSKLNLTLAVPKPRRQSIESTSDNKDDGDDYNTGAVTLPLPSHVKSITSTSNPFVKHCLKLRHSSSYRRSHGSVLVVGATPIRSVPFPPSHIIFFSL